MKLAYKINFPDNLKETYEFLQSELDRVLSDDKMRKQISSIDSKLHPGKYWRDLRNLIGKETQYKWKKDGRFPSPSWYFCAFAEQIRQIHAFQREQIALYDALQKFGNYNTVKFYQYCIDNSIPFSKAKVQNLKQCKTAPDLPRNARFVLDFAFINTQAAKMDNLIFNYAILDENKKTTWCELPIIFHRSSKYQLSNRVSKPRFSKDSDGNYYGVVTFDFEENQTHGQNIGAIDLGQIHAYTFGYINSNGTMGKDFYTPSKLTERLSKKLNHLKNEREILIKKNQFVDELFLSANYIPENVIQKWIERRGHIEGITKKITRIKDAINSEISVEIIELCKRHNCSSLFMEDLSWLGSIGGKWDHSEQQSAISQACSQESIAVYKVNAKNTSTAHPLTGEIGRPIGRDIIWSTGDIMDRDIISTMNQVQREGKRKIKSGRFSKTEKKSGIKLVSLRNKNKPTPKRVKRKNSRRRENLKLLESMRNKNLLRASQMVVVLPRISEFATWSCVEKSSTQVIDYMKSKKVYKHRFLYIYN